MNTYENIDFGDGIAILCGLPNHFSPQNFLCQKIVRGFHLGLSTFDPSSIASSTNDT